MGKAFLYGSGGASGLSFRVTGGASAPANPGENTIWVHTEAEITGWLFSPEEPQSPPEGLLWIRTGTHSPASFNALKKNGIRLCPLSAKQYLSGVWQEKTAKSFLGGAWVDWWDGLLFENGVFYEIGGWSAGTVGTTIDSTGTTRVEGSSQPVDVTEFRTLEVTMTLTTNSTQTSYVGLSGDLSDNFAAKSAVTKGSEVTVSVDISALTGSYFVVVDCNTSNAAVSYNISKIRLSS